MAQRQATSMNDQLTIAGLLVLGLTSALVGALIVAPTLAPKRLAMAPELTGQGAKLSQEQALPPEIAPGTIPGLNASANAPGDLPAGNAADESAMPNQATDESLGNAPVVIRKAGEIFGPLVPPGLKRPAMESRKRSDDKTAADPRRTVEGEGSIQPENGAAKSDTSTRRRPGDRTDSEGEAPPSGGRETGSALTPDPERPDSEKETVPKPGEGAETAKGTSGTRVYRVQSGKFNTREEATKAQLDLAKTGKGGFIVPSGDGFLLQLGVFKSRENAERAAEAARAQSIIVDVRTERPAPR